MRPKRPLTSVRDARELSCIARAVWRSCINPVVFMLVFLLPFQTLGTNVAEG